MNDKNKAVAQFFYHCIGEELPIRDILNTQGKKSKTEPHYENLTENWCQMCMNQRMKAVNRNNLDYLFLFTRYLNKGHKNHNKYIIVGYFKRAPKNRWIELNRTLKSGADEYDPKEPESCGFFVGDASESKFVSAIDAYVLGNINNARHLEWFIDETKYKDIMKKLKHGKNVIKDLRKRAIILKRLHKINSRNESCSSSCRY